MDISEEFIVLELVHKFGNVTNMVGTSLIVELLHM